MSINTSSTRPYNELPTTRLKPEQKQQLRALLPEIEETSAKLKDILGSYQSVTSQPNCKHTYYSSPSPEKDKYPSPMKDKYKADLDRLRQKCGQPSSSSPFDHLPPPTAEWIQKNPNPPKKVQFSDWVQIKEFPS